MVGGQSAAADLKSFRLRIDFMVEFKRLHPGAIILGLIAGAALGGFWGVLLAVPLMAAFKIVVGHYWRTRVLGQSWEEASETLLIEKPERRTFFSWLLRRRRAVTEKAEDPAEPEKAETGAD